MRLPGVSSVRSHPKTRSPRPFGKLRRGASAAPTLALDRWLGPNGLGVSGRQPVRARTGFSLVELMVTFLVAIVVLGFLSLLWRFVLGTEGKVREIDDVRYAASRMLGFIKRDVRSAQALRILPEGFGLDVNFLDPGGKPVSGEVLYLENEDGWLRIGRDGKAQAYAFNRMSQKSIRVSIELRRDSRSTAVCDLVVRDEEGLPLLSLQEKFGLGSELKGLAVPVGRGT